MINLYSAIFGLSPRNTSVGDSVSSALTLQLVTHTANLCPLICRTAGFAGHERMQKESAMRVDSTVPRTNDCSFLPVSLPITHRSWKTIKVFLGRLATGLSAVVSGLILTLYRVLVYLSLSHIPTMRSDVSFSRFNNTSRILRPLWRSSEVLRNTRVHLGQDWCTVSCG